MVKGQHKSYSSSEESDDEIVHRKKKRDKHRMRSRSPEEYSHRGGHHKNRHRSRSSSPGDHKSFPVRIKPDPDADEQHNYGHHRIKREPGYDHRVKREPEYERSRELRPDRHRDRDARPVRVKQEAYDDSDPRQQRHERRRNDDRRRENHQQRQRQGEDRHMFGGGSTNEPEENSEPAKPKEQPNFELSGKLTEDTNTYKGIVIKYNEPPEARKPKKRWRLYPFKNDEALKPFHMHRQSAYLFGRERLIADIPVDHPSCSKQHAVFQYRLVPYEKEDGRRAHKIAPYIIDLDSANGTYINNKKMEPQRYYELFEKDVIKFGYSSRDYVLLHDKSDTTEVEDSD